MSRPIPNVTLGGYRPNQVKINSIGIGIDDETLNSLNLNSSQFMVVGGQTNDIYNLIVDSEGVVINSSIVNRAATSSYSNEYALFVDGNIFVTGKVDTSSGTLSNIAGGGGGGAFACNYWMPVRKDIPSSTNIFYDGRINVANESQSRSNNYRVNIVDNANYTINNAQLAIQNQVGSIARTAILGYSNLSPVIFNSSTAPIEFHAARTKTYFDSIYNGSSNLPRYTSNINAPHLVINADGNIGIKVSPNPPITYTLRTTDGQPNPEVIPITISNKPVDLHVDGTTYSCNMLMYDYESRSIKNLDDLYVRKLGVTFAASQVEPGYFAMGDYSFHSNVSIGGPTEEGFNLTVYGKVHMVEQLYADKAFLTSNLVAQDTLQVLGTTYFENDVIANENVQIYQNLVVWGGIYADSNSMRTIVPGGSNSNITVPISFIAYTAEGWSNIYPQGAGFITPGKVGIGINSEYDTVPSQLSVISRDSNIYGLSLVDKTNNDFTKAFFVGHQRSNIINGMEDASVIFATPSSTSSYFNFTPNPAPQNMYFYPGQYDKTILGNNTASDNTPPTFSLYETGQAAVNSFIPNANLQLYVNGSIGFSSNIYVVDDPANPTKLAQFKYGPVVGITNDIGVSYNDPSSPYVGINREPDNRYGLAVNGGIQADNYYTSDNRKGVIWKDSTTANSDTSATTTNGLYAISKVGIGINQPSYILDIQGNNEDIGNNYGTYVRLNKSILDESLSNTGIRFDGITKPWFVNVEEISTAITRYHVGCSPDVYSLVDTSNAVSYIYWSSNAFNTYTRTSNITSNTSYVNTVITTSNLTINTSNIVNNSNIYNLYNITYLSNVSSNITSNINNIPNIPAITYNIGYDVLTSINTGIFTTLTTSSNYSTPAAPTRSNIINTSNVINTSNITNTSNIVYYVNTSNYVYSSNSTGIMIQNDSTKGIYSHQVVIGGNASLIENSYNNINPNPNAILTVNGDTSIMGNLNVSGYITANNIVDVISPGNSNVPSIQADDLFIGGKDIFINPTNKMYINYTQDILDYSIEQTNKTALNVYQDLAEPIAHFVAKGDTAMIEIMSKAINYSYTQDPNKNVNDGILRFGVIPQSQGNQVIGFQDGLGNSYMTFRKLGNKSRAMGINTETPSAQLHIVNDSTSLNDKMLKLTYDNGGSGDTAIYAPNITFEKQYEEDGNVNKKQWLIEGPTYGTDLYDQLSFKFVKITPTTSTSNTILSITSNGCIGINNTTPSYLLDIVTSNINDGRNHGIRLWNKMNMDTAQLAFQSGNSPDIGGDISADYIMYSCNSEFIFRQRKSGGTTNPLFYFDSDANLGINTTPSIYYDVNIGGKLNVAESIFLNGRELFNTSNTSGSTIQGTSNIYLLPAVTAGGGIVVNGQFPTGNLLHIFNDNTGSANMTVYDSILDTALVYYRNRVSASEYNVYQMYSSNASFGLAYKNEADRSYTMPTSGLENVLYINGVSSTNYKEHDVSLFGNLTLTSSVRGTPKISFGSNGTITGNDQNGSLYIMPGYSSNVGIGTILPRSMLDIYGTLLVSGNVGIGTMLAKEKLDVNGNMCITGKILPSQCNVFDIGSSNYRFRDIYLSGNTIDLDGTLLQRDSVTGGLKIISDSGNSLDTSVKNLYTTDNIGIGTTIARQNLDVIGKAIISQNVGIGTTLPRQLLDVQGGDIIVTGNIGIGTSLPTQKLDVVGNIKASGQVLANASDGVNTPSYSWSGDTNTGMFNAGENSIGFTTNGGEKMRIITNGNVGIGTAIPRQKLDIFGSAIVSSSVGIGTIVSVNALGVSGAMAIGATYIGTVAPANGMIVSGNVGIGTVTTRQNLDVIGTAIVSSSIGIGTTVSANALGVSGAMAIGATYIGTVAPANGMIVSGNVGIGTVTTRQNLDVIGTAIISENVGIGTTVSRQKLDIQGGNAIVSGSVGIGITLFNGFALNVSGTANVSSTVTAPTFVGNLAGVANASTIASNALGLSGTPSITVGAISASTATISGTLITSNLTVLGSNTIVNTYTISTSNVSISNIVGFGPALSVSQKGNGSNYPIADFYDVDVSTSVPVFRIADGGNIGIGTTAPSDKLQVYGNIRIGGSGDDNTNYYLQSAGQLNILADSTSTNSTFSGLRLDAGISGSTVNNHINFATQGKNSMIIGYNQFVGIQPNQTTYDFNSPPPQALSVLGNSFVRDNVGIGTTIMRQKLDVFGSAIVSSSVGIGTTVNVNALGVSGAIAIGSTYTGTVAPTDGMIVSGNVGIGTTLPRTIFHTRAPDPSSVNGIIGQFSRDGAGDIGISFTQSGVISYGIVHRNGGGLAFVHNLFPTSSGTERMRIDHVGNVGIGTTIVRKDLDVIGTAIVSSSIGIGTTVSANALGVSGAMAIGSTYIGTVAPANGMIVSGNVGIGTVTPSKKLDVSGDINFTGGLFQNGSSYVANSQWTTSGTSIYYNTGNVGVGTTLPVGKLNIAYQGGLAEQSLVFGNGSTFTDQVFSINWGNDTGIGPYQSSYGAFNTKGLAAHINGTDEFSIKSSGWNNLFGVKGGTGDIYLKGNVGIGTTIPLATLHIANTTANVPPILMASAAVSGIGKAGSIEYDGTSLYTTLNTNYGRATIPATLYTSGSNASAGITGTTNYPLFLATNDTITLPIGTYLVKLAISMDVSGSTRNSELFINIRGGGNAVGTFSWRGVGSVLTNGSTNSFPVAATALGTNITVTATTAASSRTYFCMGEGLLKITTGGTITPSYQFTTTLTSGTLTLYPDNYMILQVLDTQNTSTFGPVGCGFG